MIKLFIVFAIFFVFQCYAQTCPILLGQPPQNVTLSYCSQYDGYACCYDQYAQRLRNSTATTITPYYGNASCAANLVDVNCAFTCGPNQSQYINIQFAGVPEVSVYINPDYANQTYNICKDICIFNQGYARDIYPNASAFWEQFNTDNDPTYVPSANNPRIFYLVGYQPGGGNTSVILPVIGPSESVQCPSTTGTTAAPVTTGAGEHHVSSVTAGSDTLKVWMEVVLLCVILALFMH